MSCHHSHTTNITDILDPNLFASHDLWLFLVLFITGLSGSFAHCIGMCGPIALGQMSIRIMEIPNKKLNEWNKIKCAASLPYYFGKAITYSILAIIALKISNTFQQFSFFKYTGVFLMVVVAIFFLKTSLLVFFGFPIYLLDKSIGIKKRILNIKLINFIVGKTKYLYRRLLNLLTRLRLKQTGWQGWLFGLILGMIPCGLVYSSIVLVLSNTDRIWVAAFGMFFFGLGTIPGLFIVSYFGQQILVRWSKTYTVVYSINMLFNAYLLLSYAKKFLYM